MHVLVVYAHPNRRSFTHALLEEFIRGLADGGHTYEINDLYAIGFDPVYTERDAAFFMDDTVPEEVLERFNLRQRVLDSVGGGLFGPIKKLIAKRRMEGASLRDIARAIGKHKPKDVLIEQEKIARSDAIAVIAINLWMHFPAILKGWVTRVFTHGFAFRLSPEGWQGNVKGRIPLLKLKKALIMQPTFFSEEDYKSTGLYEAMRKTVDLWGFYYPGIPDVHREFFYRVPSVDEQTRREYLHRAYTLGKEF
ncbi:MAG: NAD(P)H-dependent oxidoreductase [Candidatus Zixiibacteriota bacterium]|nr:MAG: NAD(P)H-dependent oxidoreductase [candidate division Zixibacteria bacterium]